MALSRRLAGLLVLPLVCACSTDPLSAGRIEGTRQPAALLTKRSAVQNEAIREIRADTSKQILFGDLHVHSTYSVDAFVFSLPFLGGEGAHPPADACDFARYCAGVDFFALTDHAEGLTPAHWQRIKESLRDCNARAGDTDNPDLVAFVGWEWTQVGATPETHYGHKNVLFAGLADDQLPSRPITSLPDDIMGQAPNPWVFRLMQGIRPFGLADYADFLSLVGSLASTPNCEKGIDTRELPTTCRENAATPQELFEKLDQWGFDSLVIPHGLAWGEHAPPGARLDNQLTRQQHDPARQRLLEVFSGHGNSEEYRAWPPPPLAPDDSPRCPEPQRDFLPCCWQAGEIARARCGDLPAAECEASVDEAKQLALAAGTAPHLVFPDTRPEDWLDCDQCRDCFKPAFALRPGESAQYSLAIANREARQPDGSPLRFRWGFIGSSDDHRAQPGTGYKQLDRRHTADVRGLRSETHDRFLRSRIVGEQKNPGRAQAAERGARTFAALLDVERGASFMYPGGLVAVHAGGRDRQAIWTALKRREVYGTSGPRILLWFDLVDADGGRSPMGSELALAGTPRFTVRAAGSLRQETGCPTESVHGLSTERLDQLCRGECYNPGDERYPIVAIEVVRIRPQLRSDESVAGLIEDPWRRFECPPDPTGCSVTFDDTDFTTSGRDAVYYVRALQEQTEAINGANQRAEFDASGNVVRTSPCHGNYRTPADDDCLAPVQERAWSSPIFVDQLRALDTIAAIP